MEYQPTTILKEVDKGLQQHDHKVLFATKRGGKWIETGKEEFLTKVRHAALGLYELGVRRGDRVSLHSENSAEWLICDQAVLSIGAVNIPIFETQPGEQIKYILENARANVHIVSNDKLFSDTKPLIESIESLEGVIKIFGSRDESVTSFEELLEKGARRHNEDPDLFDQLKAKVEPDDLATLIYTSGTTGDPKGVMLTHWNIASNLLASLERVPFEENAGGDLRMLSYLPLSHVFERMITYLYIRTGYPIYYIEKVEQIRDDFKHINPFYLATVPRLLEKIHTGIKVKGQEMSGLKKQLYYWAINRAEKYDPEHPPTGLGALKHKIADKFVYARIRELFGDNLLGVVSGGAALSSNLFCFMNALGIQCIQGYGLTETSPVLSVHDRNHMRVGSSGPPLSNVDIRVADDGEIWARGPNIMKGYYRDEEKTNEVFAEDGWLKTGDVGKLEDNYLFVTDRKKSVFKLSTGKYIAPQTIENRLIESGFIEQAMVLGYQRKFCSALIVPNYENVDKRLKGRRQSRSEEGGVDPAVRELIQEEVDKVNAHLSPWETVKKFVILEEPFSVESGELTPTLKIKRSKVKEHYEEEINSIYEEEDVAQADG